MKLNTILASKYQIREQLSQKAGRQTFLAEDLRSQAYKFDKILNADGSSTRQAVVTVNPELSIILTPNQYSIGVGLSQLELWWIGKELSDFLNLELQVIYPTPKMPAEVDC
jgi:hypothetical protein